jgi:hypothetical protein
MKADLQVKGGAFTADGIMIEPAAITLYLTELQLHEYNSSLEAIIREWSIDTTNPVFRHNKDVIVKGSTAVHDGKNPVQGNRERL